MGKLVDKVKRATDSLPCKITDEERLEFADALADANHAVDAAMAAKASAMKQFNSEISLAVSRRDRIANIVSSRTEYREVTVEERWSHSTDKFTRTRTDTGEVIFERRLTDEEKQLELVSPED